MLFDNDSSPILLVFGWVILNLHHGVDLLVGEVLWNEHWSIEQDLVPVHHSESFGVSLGNLSLFHLQSQSLVISELQRVKALLTASKPCKDLVAIVAFLEQFHPLELPDAGDIDLFELLLPSLYFG